MRILPKLVYFVFSTVKRFSIDESHGLTHAFQVLHHSHNILESLLPTVPYLENHRNIIYTSALVHDLCDRKYNPEEGIRTIKQFLHTETDLSTVEIEIIVKIINTMSYSKVKKNGFPNLGIYQWAYHIVREADLLAAYEVDRSIIYNMNHVDTSLDVSIRHMSNLCETRFFKHNDDKLFLSDYSKTISKEYEQVAFNRMSTWQNIQLSEREC
jgi:HD superfamily phosphodiesterase